MDCLGGTIRRPSVDDNFMELAHHVSRRSTCFRRCVGAVIVKDKHVLATGYNGVPRGLIHCIHTGCIRMGNPNIELYGERSSVEIKDLFMNLREIPSGSHHELCTGVHAEQNAIIQAAYFGVSIRDAEIYTTTYPCVICARMILNSRIKRIVFDADYIDPISKELLNTSKIIIEQYQSSQRDFLQMTLDKYVEIG